MKRRTLFGTSALLLFPCLPTAAAPKDKVFLHLVMEYEPFVGPLPDKMDVISEMLYRFKHSTTRRFYRVGENGMRTLE
jgi:hypothetical protein